MQIHKNILLTGSDNKPITTDIFFIDDKQQKPVIIYAHGFNGFKDWGNFDLIAKQFAEAGFVFIKFNFSHNGTTPEHPEDFADPEAYGNNNYTKELYDLQVVIDWAVNNNYSNNMNASLLFLIGHSRGGGIVIIKAAAEPKVKAIATWASVSECKTPWSTWNEEKINEWKQSGVQYYTNARTKQQLPLYYQLYQNYIDNQEQLNVIKAMANLSIPILICHGTKDEAVNIDKAYQLKKANPSATLFVVQSDHVFGRKHPWEETNLPQPMQQVVNESITFFRNAAGTF